MSAYLGRRVILGEINATSLLLGDSNKTSVLVRAWRKSSFHMLMLTRYIIRYSCSLKLNTDSPPSG